MKGRTSGGAARLMLAAVERQEEKRAVAWLAGRLELMPQRWAAHLGAEHSRRGGLASSAANAWLLDATEPGRGRLPLGASDDDIRGAAKEAAQEARDICMAASESGAVRGQKQVMAWHRPAGAAEPVRAVVEVGGRGLMGGAATLGALGAMGFGLGMILGLLDQLCGRWGVVPAEVKSCGDAAPAVARMTCDRWWLRRLRRAHSRRCEGAAIVGGVVRRGMWPYCSQDGVERRKAQLRRGAAALANAVLEDRDTGQEMSLAEIVAGSVSNPEIKRGELMVRIRGADAYRAEMGWSCELWTVTCPSRFHAQRITGAVAEPNPAYCGATPKEAQGYISSVWARWRAACARRGLVVAGLRTAEPHHDGCPHWHIVAYGPARDLRFARRLLRVYALRDTPDEPGAREHRFTSLAGLGGQAGARYAEKYIAKNINGAGLEGERDTESGRKISASVERVSAWAAAWGIRQFQFFGMPKVGVWRCLRRFRQPVAPVGAALEKAREAADRADWADFWRAMAGGAVKLVRRVADRLTQYGDIAVPGVAGVVEGARQAMLPVRNWVIHWAGRVAGGVGFDFPRSGVNNCTGQGALAGEVVPKRWEDEAVAELFAGAA